MEGLSCYVGFTNSAMFEVERLAILPVKVPVWERPWPTIVLPTSNKTGCIVGNVRLISDGDTARGPDKTLTKEGGMMM